MLREALADLLEVVQDESVSVCQPPVGDDPFEQHDQGVSALHHFRDGSGIPDNCFELTGRLILRQRIHRLEVVGQSLAVSGEAFLRYIG